MADIKQIKVGSTTYDIIDQSAQDRLDELVPSSATVGSTTKGIYLNNGKLTACGEDFAAASALTAESTTRSTADSALSTRIDNLEARGRFLSTWDASTGKPSDLPSTIATTAYVYKTGDYYVVKTAGNKNPSVPSGNTIPAGTTLASWTYFVTGDDLSVNDSLYFTGSAWQILHTPVSQATWGTIGGTLSNQTDLQTALDEKVVKGTETSSTSLTTGSAGDHTHSVSVSSVTATASKLDTISVTPAVSNGTATRVVFGTSTTASKATAGTAVALAKVGTAVSCDDITAWTTNTPTSITSSYDSTNKVLSISFTAGSAAALSYTARSIAPAVAGATITPYTFSNVTVPVVSSATSVAVAKAGTAVTVADGSVSASGTGSSIVTSVSVSSVTATTSSTGAHTHSIAGHTHTVN